MNRAHTLSSLVLASVFALPAIALADPPSDARSGADPRPVAGQSGPHRDWHQGDRLPANYRDARYVVNDWRVFHLKSPPKGYHWLQIDDQYVLASRKGGVVSDVQPAR
jgi:Ni/Co efflux regulator RcnB